MILALRHVNKPAASAKLVNEISQNVRMHVWADCPWLAHLPPGTVPNATVSSLACWWVRCGSHPFPISIALDALPSTTCHKEHRYFSVQSVHRPWGTHSLHLTAIHG